MIPDNVEILPAALREIEEAEEWYLARSRRAAAAFLREVEMGLALICQTPGVWPRYEAGTQRYSLRTYPYSLIYRQTDPGVVVVAVAHHRRRPGYWRDR